MANVKINTTNTTGGYQQPVNPNTTGVLANGFYPQNASSNDAAAGVERDVSGNLVMTDAIAGSKTLTQLSGVTTTVNAYTSSSSWTKPDGATMARLLIMGGGGGGAAGTSGAMSSNRPGGGGGGAGQFVDSTISLSGISGSVTVTVGAAGTGGATSAAAGVAGGASSFGTAADAWFVNALGGVQGGLGSSINAGTSYAASVTSSGTAVVSSGGSGSTSIAGGSTAVSGLSGGGGGGGAITSNNMSAIGGGSAASPSSGLTFYSRGVQATALGTTATATNGAAGNTTQIGLGLTSSVFFGTGGAGGGGGAGNGGAAAANTGGGGGGGAAGASPAFGTGGSGGTGWIVIISW